MTTNMPAFLPAPPVVPRRRARLTPTCRPPRLRAACAARASGDVPSLAHSLDAALAHLRPSAGAPPTVHLVGTGPGDPGLLTLRAVSLMSRADVVLYDRLVSPAILSYVNAGATMVYVGKEAGFHTRTQEEIHVLLRAFAAEGKTVVRLKGGDPFVFGRGGEEVDFLERRGVEVHAVPGITAAAGIAAALGVPLTKRGVASSVRFVTGHAQEGGAEVKVGAVDADTTLVVYMGLGRLAEVVSGLEEGGLSMRTPSVAVERGTTPEERVVVAEVGELETRVREAGLQSPTLIIVGEVVRLGRCWRECEEAAAGEGRGEVVAQRAAREA